MKKELKTFSKIGFYLVSMILFLVIVMILGTDIPVCFEKPYTFIGFRKCFSSLGIIIPFVCLILLLIAGCFLFYLFLLKEGSLSSPVEVTTIKNINIDIMTFVGTYFLPLVSFSIDQKWQHVLVLAILFVVIGIIYVKADLYYINPTLLLFHFNVYEIKGEYEGNNIHQIVIINDELKEKEKYRYINIGDGNICYAKKYLGK